ncbi:MAG: glycosyltransferase [Betaproteobacteria bacterium]|nr:glycosyltransferase [Betaproteobacteria bacterium]
MESIAFVIPTKDRPDDLRRMLESLAAQSTQPHQVIVVDGSDPPIRHVVDGFPALPLDYVRVFPPSLARQRNAGMQQLRAEITLAGYLDDDVVLEPDAVASMLTCWRAASPDTGGIAFNIVNNPVPGKLGFKRLFGIDHPVPGRILSSGCPSSFWGIEHDIETDWLCGGATVWRRAVISSFPYDEWFIGTGFMEDVDFSFAVRARYRLAVAAHARLAHYSHPIRADRERLLGKWQVVNRMYFVRKYSTRGLSRIAAWWASLGMVLIHAASAILRGRRRHWNRAVGNLAGIAAEIAGRRDQVGGHLK